jgi:hypothetical protein
MLRTAESIEGYGIQATDGEIGRVREFYFDDVKWGIRYLVVDTGSWFTRNSVLISPYSITGVDDVDQTIRVSLTLEQVKGSPDIDTHKPVSRQLEGEYSDYYGYGNYWTGPYLWGVGGYPSYPMPEAGTVPAGHELPEEVAARAASNPEDVHLRSTDKVTGYHILGTDDNIGHVQDFIFDDEAWAIRYLVVDTRNWWPGGKKILLATQWIDRIDWTESSVQTSLTREQIQSSPEYDDRSQVDRNFEMALHRHYRREGYWDV